MHVLSFISFYQIGERIESRQAISQYLDVRVTSRAQGGELSSESSLHVLCIDC